MFVHSLQLVHSAVSMYASITIGSPSAAGAGADPAAQARLAWQLGLGREPSTSELEAGIAFINAQLQERASRKPEDKGAMKKLALADFCQTIFALNEFIYVD